MEDNVFQYDILKSGIQKYIRRSIKNKALLCLAKLLRIHNTHRQWLNLVKRLGVIACEDIAIADLSAIYYVMRNIITICNYRSNYIKMTFEIKYKLLAPLVLVLCESEKCRITDHIYHAIYSTIEDKPKNVEIIEGNLITKDLDLDDCVELKHDGLIYYWNFGNKQEVLEKIKTKMSTVKNIENFFDTLDTNAKYVKEGFLMYYAFILTYVHNISFEKKEYEINIDLYDYDGTEDFIIDDFVIDKHTKLGRSRGKNIVDFINEGTFIIPESSWTNKNYLKKYNEALIKKFT